MRGDDARTEVSAKSRIAAVRAQRTSASALAFFVAAARSSGVFDLSFKLRSRAASFFCTFDPLPI